MITTLLIDKEDIRNYKDIDKKYDVDKLSSYILEVQNINLFDILGDDFAIDVLENSTTGKYTDLLEGSTYLYNNKNYYNRGLKEVLIYYFLIKDVIFGDTFHSRQGAIKFTNNSDQHFEKSNDIDNLKNEYNTLAQNSLNSVIKYLNYNQSAYPLWEIACDDESPIGIFTFKI